MYKPKNEIEARFHEAMMNIYHRAKKEAGYNATRYLHMVGEHGGKETAQLLINAETPSEGYTALWERKRLDLTVEALVLQPEWASEFTDAERAKARKRLVDYGYQLP